MVKERLTKERCDWILKRIKERKESQRFWAEKIGINYFLMNKVLHQTKHLPDKYDVKWGKMEETLKGDAPYEGL